MSGSLNCPSSEDCIAFIRAHFAGRIERDYLSPHNHHVFEVRGLATPISVPLQRKQIPDRTFHNILQCAELTVKEYREIAGDSKKLKTYVKARRREAAEPPSAEM